MDTCGKRRVLTTVMKVPFRIETTHIGFSKRVVMPMGIPVTSEKDRRRRRVEVQEVMEVCKDCGA